MKKIYSILLSTFCITVFIFSASNAFAGNKDRAGEAGASQLLINPWARSSGWGGMNTSNTSGIESMYTNIAGLAQTTKTELIFAHSQWLYSAANDNISINAFGLSQHVGESGVIGISAVAIGFGDVVTTTVSNPDGGIGKFSPRLMNINLGYAKAFSDNIYGGVNVKIINESISNVSGMGFALDGGIQYIAGKDNNIKFGVSLKNIGGKMKYSGDGLAIRSFINESPNQITIQQRSAAFELPSLINIGASYDFLLAREEVSQDNGKGSQELVAKNVHRLTTAINFRANSFTKDQYGAGVEYAFKEMLMLRAGYVYEEGLLDDEERTNAELGLNGGFTVEMPINKNGTTLGLDFSYRQTENFDGTRSLGVRINL